MIMKYNSDFLEYFIEKNNRACNIIFEGIDGSGKSFRSAEFYKFLKNALDDRRFEINLYNHPSSEICKEEREILLNNNLNPIEEVKVINKCKNKLIDYINKNNHKNKYTINIIDRWVYSTYVYQNSLNDETVDTYKNSEISKLISDDYNKNNLEIDLIVYNNISYKNFVKRLEVREKKIDSKEKFLLEEDNFNNVSSIYIDTVKTFDIHKQHLILNRLFYLDSKEFIDIIIKKIINKEVK